MIATSDSSPAGCVALRWLTRNHAPASSAASFGCRERGQADAHHGTSPTAPIGVVIAVTGFGHLRTGRGGSDSAAGGVEPCRLRSCKYWRKANQWGASAAFWAGLRPGRSLTRHCLYHNGLGGLSTASGLLGSVVIGAGLPTRPSAWTARSLGCRLHRFARLAFIVSVAAMIVLSLLTRKQAMLAPRLPTH